MKNNGIAMRFYGLERWLYLNNLEFFSKIVFRVMQLLLGCTIPYTVDLDKTVHIAHYHGIVMNIKCRVGAGTTIYQNTTLGGLKGHYGPTIGSNCIIGAGAVILGEIIIGNNVNIGANAVVLKDVPDNCTVVGVPAKIVKHR